MAVYVCGKCRFTFERREGADFCLDCGKPNIREATEEEIAEYGRVRSESERDGLA